VEINACVMNAGESNGFGPVCPGIVRRHLVSHRARQKISGEGMLGLAGAGMTLIDRYVLTIFFRAMVALFLSLVGMIVVADVFINLDEFIEYGKVKGSVVSGLLEYYLPQLLAYLDWMSGVLPMLGAMFVIALLYRTNELTSILAAGVSKERVMRPILVAAGLWMALAIVNREIWLPKLATRLSRTPQQLTSDAIEQIRPVKDHHHQILFNGKQMNIDQGELIAPRLILYGAGARLGEKILGRVAIYRPASPEHPQGFLIQGVELPISIASLDSVWLEQEPIVLTPKDTPWLKSDECFVATEIPLELMSATGATTKHRSTWSLIEQLRQHPRYCDLRFRSAVHGRLARPALDAMLFLFGVPLILRRQDRNLFWVAGAGLILVLGYLAIQSGGPLLGSAGVGVVPWVAVWGPMVLLFPVAWIMTQEALWS
jgi:lipopolysaccharide export system permease protein